MKLLDNLFLIKSSSSNDGELTNEIELVESHFIYKAHFPENPITPGVCIVQIAQEMLEMHLGKNLLLNTLNNIKYMAIMSPTDNSVVKYRINYKKEDESTLKIKVVVNNENATFSKFSATYNIL
jgi:3-hydroxyacyl-[acyl-carrier-protein] dehydratase